MPAPRRSRRKQGQEQQAEWQAVQWPLLKATWEGRDAAELAASHDRAGVLSEQGYGALVSWLLSDPSPSELQAMREANQAQQQAQQAAVDLFD